MFSRNGSKSFLTMAAFALALVLIAATACDNLRWFGLREPGPEQLRSQALSLWEQGYEEHEKKGDYTRAIEVYQHALSLSPRPMILYHLGHCYMETGDLDRAQEYLSRALEMQPGYQSALVDLQKVFERRARQGAQAPQASPASSRQHAELAFDIESINRDPIVLVDSGETGPAPTTEGAVPTPLSEHPAVAAVEEIRTLLLADAVTSRREAATEPQAETRTIIYADAVDHDARLEADLAPEVLGAAPEVSEEASVNAPILEATMPSANERSVEPRIIAYADDHDARLEADAAATMSAVAMQAEESPELSAEAEPEEDIKPEPTATPTPRPTNTPTSVPTPTTAPDEILIQAPGQGDVAETTEASADRDMAVDPVTDADSASGAGAAATEAEVAAPVAPSVDDIHQTIFRRDQRGGNQGASSSRNAGPTDIERPVLNTFAYHYNKGREFVLVRENARALEEFDKAARLEAPDIDALVVLGTAYADLREFDRAEKVYQNAIALQPRNMAARISYGDLCLRRGGAHLARALEHYQTAADEHPDEPRPHFKIGLLYLQKSDPDWGLAREAFLRAVAIDPTFKYAFSNLGFIAMESPSPEPDRAIEYFQKCLEIDETYAKAHLNLGILFEEHKKQPEQAYQHYSRYIELGGDRSEDVRKWLRDIEASR